MSYSRTVVAQSKGTSPPRDTITAIPNCNTPFRRRSSTAVVLLDLISVCCIFLAVAKLQARCCASVLLELLASPVVCVQKLVMSAVTLSPDLTDLHMYSNTHEVSSTHFMARLR